MSTHLEIKLFIFIVGTSHLYYNTSSQVNYSQLDQSCHQNVNSLHKISLCFDQGARGSVKLLEYWGKLQFCHLQEFVLSCMCWLLAPSISQASSVCLFNLYHVPSV